MSFTFGHTHPGKVGTKSPPGTAPHLSNYKFTKILSRISTQKNSGKVSYLSAIQRVVLICYSSRVPTQIAFSNSLCFPCLTVNFPSAKLRDL